MTNNESPSLRKKSLIPVSERVGKALRFFMRSKGITDVELAKRSGLARTTLRTYLGGSLKSLNLDKLEKMARVLGRTLPELLDYGENLRGYFKLEGAAGKYDLFNLSEYRIRIECESPLNANHAHGILHFFPSARYEKQKESDCDIWLYLKSEGGILTIDYNQERTDLHGGEKVLFNARHPFRLRYLTDKRNQRKLEQPPGEKQNILCSFSSSPPFWLY